MPVTHRIKITSDDRGYSTQGAASVHCAFNPMRSAAIDLLARGYDPASKLAGLFEGSQISPVSLVRLAKPYSPPRTNHRAADPSRNID